MTEEISGAKFTKCVTCKGDISVNAPTCPHCGEKEPCLARIYDEGMRSRNAGAFAHLVGKELSGGCLRASGIATVIVFVAVGFLWNLLIGDPTLGAYLLAAIVGVVGGIAFLIIRLQFINGDIDKAISHWRERKSEWEGHVKKLAEKVGLDFENDVLPYARSTAFSLEKPDEHCLRDAGLNQGFFDNFLWGGIVREASE